MLAHLARLYASGRAELFVLYGRRRLGKTELLRSFCQGKPTVFFVATLGSDREQLAAFSQEVWRFGHTQVGVASASLRGRRRSAPWPICQAAPSSCSTSSPT